MRTGDSLYTGCGGQCGPLWSIVYGLPSEGQQTREGEMASLDSAEDSVCWCFSPSFPWHQFQRVVKTQPSKETPSWKVHLTYLPDSVPLQALCRTQLLGLTLEVILITTSWSPTNLLYLSKPASPKVLSPQGQNSCLVSLVKLFLDG